MLKFRETDRGVLVEDRISGDTLGYIIEKHINSARQLSFLPHPSTELVSYELKRIAEYMKNGI